MTSDSFGFPVFFSKILVVVVVVTMVVVVVVVVVVTMVVVMLVVMVMVAVAVGRESALSWGGITMSHRIGSFSLCNCAACTL